MEEGSVVKNKVHAARPAGAKKINSLRNITIAAVIVLIAAVSFVSWMIYQSSISAQIDSSKYQAIFLANGQTYFGKLKNLNGDYYKLSEIYYFSNKTSTINNTSTDENADEEQGLVKLGTEVHGPVDVMVINKEQVTFFENLKNDGTVVKSILAYKKQAK